MKNSLIFLFMAFSFFSFAQPGTIDNTYGSNKTGTVSVSSNITLLSSTMQSDNKLILGGYKDTASGAYTVVRYNKEGTLDTSFGQKGQMSVTVDDLVKNIRYPSGFTCIAVQPDGKIVAAGHIYYNNTEQSIFFDFDIIVARFLPDGTPDESFGSHGRVVTELGYAEIANAIAVQADGKIVVAGGQNTDINGDDMSSTTNLLLVRYNSDGTLDKSFGKENGYVIYTNKNGDITQANALLIQPDGKLVAGGYADALSSFFLVRYQPDGTLDNTFGNNGTIKESSQSYGFGTQIKSLALDDKGRIVSAGIIGVNGGVKIFRYLLDGSHDNSFNKNGQVQLSFNGVSYAYASISTILSQSDSKLIISGSLANNAVDYTITPVLSGLNEDGTPDSSFGTDHGQTIKSNELLSDFPSFATMQSDGKIITAGNNFNSTTSVTTYHLTRFNGYPTHVSLAVRIKRFIHNHSITWNGLPADDKIAYYSVEQSGLSTKGFTPIAKLSGRSNLHDYSISNSSLLPATNYYRIKAVSIDGTIRYSEVVSADNVANSASVFPNPAKSYVMVQGLQTNATANISIKDGSGTILTRGASSGSTQYRSQVSNLLPGTYYLNITTGTKTETLPFVKE